MIKLNRHVFVCYARTDIPKVVAIIDALRLNGLELWIDQEGIKGATFWRKEIVEAITQSAVVLFFASRHSCASDNVSKELALASEEGKPILPVFIEELELSPELRYQIAGLQNIIWYENHDIGLKQIVAVLKSYSPRAASESCESHPSPIIRSRSSRSWIWPTIVTVLVLAAALTITSVMKRLNPLPLPVANPATIGANSVDPSPITPPRYPVPPDPYHLQDTYYIETIIHTSDHNPYIGLHVRYKVFVTQDGQTLDVRGEKIGEVVDDEERTLTGRGKTPIHLSGHVETPASGVPHILLSGDEGSTSRGDFSTMFDLQSAAGNLLTGTFKSTAANVNGSAVWIPEKQWLSTAWRTQ